MRTRSVLLLALALATASGLAGCFGSDDPPADGGGTGGGTNGGGTGGGGTGGGGTGGGNGTGDGGTGGNGGTGGDGGSTVNFTAYNGTETVMGGPQATGSVTVNVKQGASSLTITFARAGTVGTSALGSTAYQNFAATLTDPNATEAGTSSSIETGFTVSNPMPGDWVVALTWASPPQADISVTYDVA